MSHASPVRRRRRSRRQPDIDLRLRPTRVDAGYVYDTCATVREVYGLRDHIQAVKQEGFHICYDEDGRPLGVDEMRQWKQKNADILASIRSVLKKATLPRAGDNRDTLEQTYAKMRLRWYARQERKVMGVNADSLPRANADLVL